MLISVMCEIVSKCYILYAFWFFSPNSSYIYIFKQVVMLEDIIYTYVGL